LESFLRRVKSELGLDEARLTVCLVSDAEIARMNEKFRKKKGPTDVLSFPTVARRDRFACGALAPGKVRRIPWRHCYFTVDGTTLRKEKRAHSVE